VEKIAAIDIGSNTLRLLIVEKTSLGFRPVFRDREIVRLGRGFFPSHLLSPEAMDMALSVLTRFRNKTDAEGVARIRTGGTGVLRTAENREYFLEKANQETGVAIEILSGPEEARIMAEGVLSQFPLLKGRSAIFDLGGGSTEFVIVCQGRMAERLSLPLGAVGLTEEFLKTDPPTEKELISLRKLCRTILGKNLSKNDKIINLIGTAGTVTTLAAMVKGITDYEPDLINGTILLKDRLNQLAEDILSRPFDQRKHLPGLEPGRADIIGAGLLVVLEIMEYFSKDRLLVSDAGLLEGLIL
jgi:exopolyphosphatase/guanosine-5'-triphosphate,3'-diphosphate pyrophosphatase